MTESVWFGVRDLSLERGRRRVLDRIEFDLDAGTALLVRGPNGSGKSSLLRALLGLSPVTSGDIIYAGRRFTAGSGRLCSAALYQGHATGLKSELTAQENLVLAAGLDGTRADDRTLHATLRAVGIEPEHQLPVRHLSQGQKQRLTLARFALGNACLINFDESERIIPGRALWLLDEPSAALDAAGQALLDRLLATHLSHGGAAIIATHLPILAGHETRTLTLSA